MRPGLVVSRSDVPPSEESATEAIRLAGYPYVFTLDVPAESNESHWHDFATRIVLLTGSMTLWDDERGATHDCAPGTFVETAAGHLHHEHHEGYRAVIGFVCDPASLSRPIKKRPADRPV